MDMTTMESNVPGWLTPVAWVFLVLASASAAAIAYDIFARGNRRAPLAQELVWVGSALYLGPLALFLNIRRRPATTPPSGSTGRLDRPQRHRGSSLVAGLPGGTASAVAHVIGVPLVIASGWTIAGLDLWVMILVIGALAAALLFLHERATVAGSVAAAVAAAGVTVLAFDIGMGAWMVLLHLNGLMPAATEAGFWFLMQIGVLLGLATGYPVVARLARSDRGDTAAAT